MLYQRTIVEERNKNLVVMDVFSKLIQDRIIFIDDIITPDLANGVIAQLLYLESISKEQIDIYINTPGGSVYDGLAIYDVARLLKSPIRTIGLGLVASMGAVLMLMGSQREATKHTRIMFHQPSGRADGTVEDIKISYEQIELLKQDMYKIVEEGTRLKDVQQLFKLDSWFNTSEALAAGILTKIL